MPRRRQPAKPARKPAQPSPALLPALLPDLPDLPDLDLAPPVPLAPPCLRLTAKMLLDGQPASQPSSEENSTSTSSSSANSTYCCLTFPALPATPLTFARPACQLRYQILHDPSGLPCSVSIPRQPVSLAPTPIWIPAQSFSLLPVLLHQLNPCPGQPLPAYFRSAYCRRYCFQCPAPRCRRRHPERNRQLRERVCSLVLPLPVPRSSLSSSAASSAASPALSPAALTYSYPAAAPLPPARRGRFLCQVCLRPSLPRPSDRIHIKIYQAARDPFRRDPDTGQPIYSLARRLKAIPVWYRWQTEGKRMTGGRSTV